MDKILSAHFWIPLSRLTYCVYLVHPIAILTFVRSFETVHAYSDVHTVSNTSILSLSSYYCSSENNCDGISSLSSVMVLVSTVGYSQARKDSSINLYLVKTTKHDGHFSMCSQNFISLVSSTPRGGSAWCLQNDNEQIQFDRVSNCSSEKNCYGISSLSSVMVLVMVSQRVVSPTVVSQTSPVSSQTCRSQFANVSKSIRKRYKH